MVTVQKFTSVQCSRQGTGSMLHKNERINQEEDMGYRKERLKYWRKEKGILKMMVKGDHRMLTAHQAQKETRPN